MLVIIGLIVGGVLVGQSLINAATIRAQITQIEKFNRATNTFYGKYGALPGDITQAAVTQFGFTANPVRPCTPGCGDGNGELDGTNSSACATTASSGVYSDDLGSETLWFWQDLSANSNLIEVQFTVSPNYTLNCVSASDCGGYFPVAKIGSGASVYVYSGNVGACAYYTPTRIRCGPNFFSMGFISLASDGGPIIAPNLTVSQAAAIDSKIDDGLPTTGNVLAQYLVGSLGGHLLFSTSGPSPSATTYFDTSSGTAKYSISYNGGSLLNCGISFKMQVGD